MVTKRTTRTEELAKKDVAHFFHPIGTVGKVPQVIWEKGDGAKLWDTDGKQYIDMSSGGVQCTHLGFARKELNDAAYEQMQKIGFIFSAPPMSNIPAIEYAAELAEILPGDINHVYFTNTGTESNEIAIQIARFYWEVHGKTDKYKLMCLTHAYHGGSALTRSLGNVGMSCFGQVYPGIIRVPNYHCYLCPYNLKYPSCDILCARMVEKFIEYEKGETIAAFIAEPIQGGGAGMVWPVDEYWPIVRKILSDHNILLIADEVQNGFCRTGKFWGVDNWNIVPDMITMAKGINSSYLPFGGVGVSDKVYKDLGDKYFMGVATCDANSACVATARAALKIYKEEKLAERSARLGEHASERLLKEFSTLPCVDDVMGRGLYHSFEIALNKTTGSKFNLEATTRAREDIFSRCLERGVLTSRYDGYPRRQPLVPPLVIGEDELDRALDVILSVMKEVKPV
jgi:adenosylmethionine-8-amino-7-oxononanoate aminotransferase